MVFTSTTSTTTLGPATSKLLLSFSISHCHTLCLVLDTQHQGQLQLHVIWVELDTTSKYSYFNSTILSIASLSDRQLPWSIPFIVKWAPDADSLLSCWLVSGICFITLYLLECLQGLLMPLMCLFSVIHKSFGDPYLWISVQENCHGHLCKKQSARSGHNTKVHQLTMEVQEDMPPAQPG